MDDMIYERQGNRLLDTICAVQSMSMADNFLLQHHVSMQALDLFKTLKEPKPSLPACRRHFMGGRGGSTGPGPPARHVNFLLLLGKYEEELIFFILKRRA